TVVVTCSARNASTSSDTFRCRPWDRKRGQLARANRPAVSSPSSTLTVSSSRVTRPVARVAYHRPGPCRSMLISVRPLSFPGTRGSATRPASHGDDGAVPPDEAGGQAESVQPADRALAAQDRRGAGDVGADAARGGRPVGGQSLGGGPQVEQDPGWDTHRRVTTVEFDPAPAACGHRRLAQGACALAGPGEVPVVAEPDQALPAGGIDVTVGEFG